MSGINKVFLIGNLGADPELRTVGNGDALLTFNVATTERWLDNNKQRQESTEWHRVCVFGARAEALAKLLTRGSKVFIGGGLRTRTYDDKDGVARYVTEVRAREVELLDPPPQGSRRDDRDDRDSRDDDRGGWGRR